MVRLSVIQDKVETILNRRRTNGRFGRFRFPPSQTPARETVTLSAAFRHAFSFLLIMIAQLVIFFLIFPLIALIFVFIYFRQYFHHIPWRLMRTMYRDAVNHLWSQGTPAEYIFIYLVLAGIILAFLLAERWAWNRRAERLNREGSPSQPAVAAAPGVWPPPPSGPN